MTRQSILLVGNGPSAMKYEMGSIIDAFPLVCRFNDFRIKGFEKYVGTKSDIWVTCLLSKEYIEKQKHQFQKIYFPLTQERFIKMSMEISNSECFPKMIYEEASRINGEYFYPSSGLLAALFFINQNYDVILYGFDFFQKKQHHYCDTQEIGPNHSPENELIAFNHLIETKKVRLLSI